MKKILFTGAAAACCLTIAVPAFAYAPKKIGKVYSTDIIAYVNDVPIRSYNYMDQTFVIAEDLRNYGFDVIWNGTDRTVTITPPKADTKIELSAEKQQELTKRMTIGRPLYDVYWTDIKTKLDDSLTLENDAYAKTCNINGQTMILFSELGKYYGKTEWDPENRVAKVTTSVEEISVSPVHGISVPLGKSVPGLDQMPHYYTATIPEKDPSQETDHSITLVNFSDRRNGADNSCLYLECNKDLYDALHTSAVCAEGNHLVLTRMDERESISFSNGNVYVMHEPVNVNAVDLKLFNGDKEITSSDEVFHVFLVMDGQLYVRADSLAESLGMTSTVNSWGEGTFTVQP